MRPGGFPTIAVPWWGAARDVVLNSSLLPCVALSRSVSIGHPPRVSLHDTSWAYVSYFTFTPPAFSSKWGAPRRQPVDLCYRPSFYSRECERAIGTAKKVREAVDPMTNGSGGWKAPSLGYGMNFRDYGSYRLRRFGGWIWRPGDAGIDHAHITRRTGLRVTREAKSFRSA